MATPATLVLLRFNEPDDQVLPSDEMGALADLNVDAGLALPPVTTTFTGFGREFSNGFALDALDVVPGSSLATRDCTIQVILSWDLNAQSAYGQDGAIVYRGKGNAAAEYVCYGLELRVVNAALQIGELRWVWQDLAGNVKTQTGGQFILPPPGGYMMLTATRRWVSSSDVEIRYYAGDQLIGEFLSADGDIGGGTTGTFCVGARYSAGVAAKFLCGTIDQLRVLSYELSGEEIAASWQRMAVLQPAGYRAIRDLMQPGAPISDDPSSRIQKLLRIAGHALGYAAAQAENVRLNLLPDRAYGPALEDWEDILAEAPKAADSIATRRNRLVGHLRQSAGSSLPGVAASTADLLALATSQVQVLSFDQTVRDDFSQGLRAELWDAQPSAQWTINAGALRAQAANAALIPFTGPVRDWYTCFAAATGSRQPANGEFSSDDWFDGKQTHLIMTLLPTTLPDKGEAGIAFYDWVGGNALLFGLRNTAGVYQLVTESFQGWKSQGVVVQQNSALVTHWLHLYQQATAGKFTAAWSTTSQLTGYQASPDITSPQAFSFVGPYVRSTDPTVGLAGALDVSFDDAILRNPFGTRPFQWFIFRDPTLPGAFDLPGARGVLKRLKQAHTAATVITSKSLFCDSNDSTCDGGPCGAI